MERHNARSATQQGRDQRPNRKSQLRALARKAFARLPIVGRLYEEHRLYRTPFPPGHYSNPYPSLTEISKWEARIFAARDTIPGVDLRLEEQLRLLEQLGAYYRELPFPDEKDASTRYYFRNPMFAYADGIFLYSVLRHFRPTMVIEIGSGFSSALMLDVAERFLDPRPQFTFIEPATTRLEALLSVNDRTHVQILATPVQEVPLTLFDRLGENDILFLDTSHIAKTGSDVTFALFEILPRLKPGTIVHIHDIHYPFEYPREWLYAQRGYNEAYFVRAFLMYNDVFRITLFPSDLIRRNRQWFEQHMPLCLQNPGGSLWLSKAR